MKTAIVCLFFAGTLIANAEPSQPPEGNTRQALRSAVAAAKNGIIDPRQIDFDTSGREIDLGKMETPRLWNSALYSSPPYDPTREIEELARRENETRELIENTLNGDELKPEDVARIPYIAAAISPNYGCDVTERLLFHPSSRKFDDWFVSGPGEILKHFADKGLNKEWVIDRLIREGRLEKGSALEQKWRAKLSRNEVKKPNSSLKRTNRKSGPGVLGPYDNQSEANDGSPALKMWIVGILGAICFVGVCRIVRLWRSR